MADLFVVLSCSSFVYFGYLFGIVCIWGGWVPIHVGAPNINVVCWEIGMW
jgi:hypothetical protein